VTVTRAYLVRMHILACLDLSPVSDRVAAEAGILARATGAELTLLHAARTEPVLASGGVASPSGHRVPPADLGDRRARVAAMAERLRAEGVKVEGRVLLCDDVLVRFILDEAAAKKASYIVIGSHGHGRVFELLLGSVTQGVVRDAPVPVVVVSARHL
jgi:nucleotide-binding universal stress UspA family protein